jgi:hypothetical protein
MSERWDGRTKLLCYGLSSGTMIRISTTATEMIALNDLENGGAAAVEIPLVDVGRDGPVALAERAADRVALLVAQARRHYGGVTLRLGDRASHRWLIRNGNPYRHEIAAIAARVRVPGAVVLNLSYEWSCTSGVGPDPGGEGMRMLRTLDWPLKGLGASLVVARFETDAGDYYNATWPGFVGVLTAMAPGRFCAAINQPPARRVSGRCWFDWAIHRRGVWRQSALPPSHLLRKVFDECRTYAEAKALLVETPLCMPAFFTLAGADAEGCVIERQELKAAVHEAPMSISNHWLSLPMSGYHDRGTDTVGRRRAMDACRDVTPDEFSWVVPPILNAKTHASAIANAGREQFLLQGWEAGRAVTTVFDLQERLRAETSRTRPAPAAAARA